MTGNWCYIPTFYHLKQTIFSKFFATSFSLAQMSILPKFVFSNFDFRLPGEWPAHLSRLLLFKWIALKLSLLSEPILFLFAGKTGAQGTFCVQKYQERTKYFLAVISCQCQEVLLELKIWLPMLIDVKDFNELSFQLRHFLIYC